MAIVDASVVIKWYAKEEYSDDANRLKRAYSEGLVDLKAPCILPFEVINGLKYTYSLGEEELVTISRILDDFQITYYSFSDIEEIVTFSMKYGITIYDSAYITLGKTLGEEVYTADEKLLRKVRSLQWVKHVRDFKI
ncbi:twitching motility protein PilT [Sulfolobus acidocaldarius SUSAZ]|nr:twitching motility protein PilT [Sulfolobus acidocaldarius SUSAZ]